MRFVVYAFLRSCFTQRSGRGQSAGRHFPYEERFFLFVYGTVMFKSKSSKNTRRMPLRSRLSRVTRGIRSGRSVTHVYTCVYTWCRTYAETHKQILSNPGQEPNTSEKKTGFE